MTSAVIYVFTSFLHLYFVSFFKSLLYSTLDHYHLINIFSLKKKLSKSQAPLLKLKVNLKHKLFLSFCYLTGVLQGLRLSHAST